MGGMPGQMGGQSMAGGAPNAQALSHMNPQAMMQQQQHMQQSEFFLFLVFCLHLACRSTGSLARKGPTSAVHLTSREAF